MSEQPATGCSNQLCAGGCLARSILETFAEEPKLEAVTVDAERQTVAVATLGQTDMDRIERMLTESLERAQENRPDGNCAMLGGGGNCASCPTPLPGPDLNRFTIQH